MLDYKIFFTKQEVRHLIKEAKKIGFKIMPRLVNGKVFNVDAEFLKTKNLISELYFHHIKTDNGLSIYKYEIINLGLNVKTDNIADIFFTLLYKEIADKDYADNYKP